MVLYKAGCPTMFFVPRVAEKDLGARGFGSVCFDQGGIGFFN
jgi:hypothetical protein